MKLDDKTVLITADKHFFAIETEIKYRIRVPIDAYDSSLFAQF